MDALSEYIKLKQKVLLLLKDAELSIRYDRIEDASKLLWSLVDQISELGTLLEQAKREVI